MAKRPPYALPEDVLRIFDAQEASLTTDQTDLVRDAIDDVSSEFEVLTGHAFRLTRVGRSGTPSTYEYRGVEGNHRRPPVDVLLKGNYVFPFDSTEDDVLEYRDGRDSWEPITDQAGDEFTQYFESGKLRIYRWLIGRIFWDARDDRYIRASYRYGALGGRQDQGGQTTLDADFSQGSASMSVADAGRLPQDGTLLIYGDNVEYVDIESVDLSTNTLTVSRGERSTSDVGHSDGDTVHYCPESVRKAMAGAAARELQEYELWTDHLTDTGDAAIGGSERVESWANRYDQMLAKYSGVRKL